MKRVVCICTRNASGTKADRSLGLNLLEIKPSHTYRVAQKNLDQTRGRGHVWKSQNDRSVSRYLLAKPTGRSRRVSLKLLRSAISRHASIPLSGLDFFLAGPPCTPEFAFRQMLAVGWCE